MWQWNAVDDLWVQDPGIPIGFEGNLMDIAFDPANPDRGYAVGKGHGPISRRPVEEMVFGDRWGQRWPG